MLNVTVKTLDSQNHVFQVEDDITVQNFKDHIVATVNVPAEQQRLIYRGRVLQNDKKLSEYNVDNNTIHLVQRPPQSSSESGANDAPTSENSAGPRISMDPNSGFMFAGGNGGDSFIMGSIGIPSVQVGQNTVASAPTMNRQNSAARRLQTGNNMLNRASTMLTALEEDDEVANARSRIPEPEVQTPQDSQLQQDSAMAGGLVEDSMDIDVDDPASLGRMISQVANAASAAAVMASMRAVNEPGGGGTSRPGQQPSGTGGAPAASANAPGGEVTTARQSAPRLRELAIALQDVIAFHTRLTPFLQFMEGALRANSDYTAESGELRSVQYTFDTLSSVMHCLGHSYHAFSDLICDFGVPAETRRINAPATILVEQSTVVRATIPIAVPHFHADLQNQPRSQTPNNNTSETSGTQPQTQAQQPAGVQPQPTHIGGLPLGARFPAAPGGFMFPRAAQGPSDDNGPGISINIQANGVPDFASLLGPAFRNPRPSGSSPMSFTVNGAGLNAGGQNVNQGATGGNQPSTTGNGTQQAGTTQQAFQQRLRNDFLRQGFDALLNCHSHHTSQNRNFPNRPSDLRQYLRVQPADNTVATAGSPEFFEAVMDIFRFSSWLEHFHPLIKDFVQNYLMRGRDIKNSLHVKTYARTLSKRFLPLFKALQAALGDTIVNSNVDYDKTFSEVLTKFFHQLLNLILNSDGGPAFRTSLLQHWDQTMLQLFSVFRLCFASNEQVPSIFAEVLSDWSLPRMSISFRQYLSSKLRAFFDSVARTASTKEHTPESLGVIFNQQPESEARGASSVQQVPAEPITNVSEPEPQLKEPVTITETATASAARSESPTDSNTFHDAMDTFMSDDTWLDELVDQIPIRTRPDPPSTRSSQAVDVFNHLPQEWRSVIERDMARQMSMPASYPSSPGFESLFPTGRH